MTAIVGIVDSGKVYMGGDSATVDSSSLMSYPVSNEKVFINGEFIMGFTTSWRMGQVLQYSFKPPKYKKKKKDIITYMNTDFINAVRKTFKDFGSEGGNFLVGFRGQLFEIEGDYQVALPRDGFASCGCGHQLCLGSLHTTWDINDPELRIEKALEAAAYFSGGVKPPFIIKSI